MLSANELWRSYWCGSVSPVHAVQLPDQDSLELFRKVGMLAVESGRDVGVPRGGWGEPDHASVKLLLLVPRRRLPQRWQALLQAPEDTRRAAQVNQTRRPIRVEDGRVLARFASQDRRDPIALVIEHPFGKVLGITIAEGIIKGRLADSVLTHD